MVKYICLGMGFQAFIVAWLTHSGLIKPTPFQQTLAGVIFLILFLIHWFFEYAKNSMVSSQRRR